MRRLVLFAVLLPLVIGSCTCEQKERQNWRELFFDDGYGHWGNLSYFTIYGDVQKITVFKDCLYQNFIDDGTLPDGRVVASIKFDEYGDVVESEIEYIEKEEVVNIEKKQYEYSSSRKTLAIRSTDDYGEGEYYEYDEKDRLVKWTGGYGWSRRYDYDSQGRKIEECLYNGYGKFFDRTCWEYDNKGRVLEKACYDSEGKRREYTVYRYNWLGVLEKEEREEVDWTGSKVYKYREYDWRGRLKCPKDCRCKYDKHGNMIAKADFSGGDTVVYRYKIVYR